MSLDLAYNIFVPLFLSKKPLLFWLLGHHSLLFFLPLSPQCSSSIHLLGIALPKGSFPGPPYFFNSLCKHGTVQWRDVQGQFYIDRGLGLRKKIWGLSAY